ncbi:hypothetical protein [Streptomyces sp. NPDC006997]|uniref:hypothetical protein n=1 Tax=Streptomyces sp. NPDC006997 TaxID=3155356 RepID=UPI0033F0C52B
MGSFFRWLWEEVVGEAVLTVVACGALVGLALAFVWGWERSPGVTGSAGGVVLAFLGFAGWEVLRPGRAGRRGRLVGVAALAFCWAAAFLAYAFWSCGCL